MQYTAKEKEIIRSLAAQYMDIASLPIQQQKLDHIKRFNRLEKVRPLVTAFQLPWNELNVSGELTCVCSNRYLRGIENFFRHQIYSYNHFAYMLDMVIEPFLTIPFVAHNTGYGMQQQEDTAITDEKNDVISHHYKNQFLEEEDVEKIKEMQISYDPDASRELKQAVEQLLGDIIPIHQAGGIYIRCQMWDELAEMMGVEDAYYDIIDRPEFIHAIMERMTSSALSGIAQANKFGLFNSSENYSHCSPTYSDELLPSFMGGKEFLSKNCWAFGMAQLFTSVSPDVTAEFEIPYISKIAEQFGSVYYGCCERLDDRLDLIETIPNIKKVSCSPWNDKARFAQNLNPKLIMSQKPNPAFLAGSGFDEDIVRNDIIETLEAAKSNNLNVEFLLKDVSTVKYDPQRVDRWAKIVTQTIDRHY